MPYEYKITTWKFLLLYFCGNPELFFLLLRKNGVKVEIFYLKLQLKLESLPLISRQPIYICVEGSTAAWLELALVLVLPLLPRRQHRHSTPNTHGEVNLICVRRVHHGRLVVTLAAPVMQICCSQNRRIILSSRHRSK